MDYMVCFNRLSNVEKKQHIVLSSTVLGLKLLHDVGLSNNEKKLVMSEIDFKRLDHVYKEVKTELAKYLLDTTSLAEGCRIYIIL